MTKDFKLVEPPDEIDIEHYLPLLERLIMLQNEISTYKIFPDRDEAFTEYSFIADKIQNLEEMMTECYNRDRMIKVTQEEDYVLSAIRSLEEMSNLYNYQAELFDPEYSYKLVKVVEGWLTGLIEDIEKYLNNIS